MARFKYLGEPPRSWVVAYGPCDKICVPTKTLGMDTLLPIFPATQFVVDADIGYNITDETSILALETNPSFQRIS